MAKQRDKEGIASHRKDNGFPWVEAIARVQALLQRLSPRLVAQGITTLSCPDVMRFLGKPLTGQGEIPSGFSGEVVSDFKCRQDGIRIRHRCNRNAIKAYDKAPTPPGSVLRRETPLNDPTDCKVFGPKQGGSEEDLEWRPMRKGVADRYRRAQVSEKANLRSLETLCGVVSSPSMGEVLEGGCIPTTWHGKRVRGLNLFSSDDLALLEAVSRGAFRVKGLRKRDLQRLLYQEASRRRSGRVTRLLRLLGAQGILTQVAHPHRYQVSPTGRSWLTALLRVRKRTVNQLLATAPLLDKAA